MRVLQLVDSLDVGGTERVAVNIANALSTKIETSFLCATRREGILKQSLNAGVGYLFLNKKSTFDISAVKTLKHYIEQNNINILHAHSSSFFLAVLVKLRYSKVKIIWHDHYGNSAFLNNRKLKVLKLASYFFEHVLCVNQTLKDWAISNLHCKHVNFIPNFAVSVLNKPETQLKGIEGKRLVHLANLRPQKDHETLLEAFAILVKSNKDWTLHCVGKDFNDDYSKQIKQQITALKLEKHVFLYGSKPDIAHILKQSTIGVLSSKSEGLPLALLEYGLANLPCVATNVGDCKKVISSQTEGFLVEKQNSYVLAEAITKLIKNKDLQETIAKHLYKKVTQSFSEEAIINKLLTIYKQYV